jgi:hypothetical protein
MREKIVDMQIFVLSQYIRLSPVLAPAYALLSSFLMTAFYINSYVRYGDHSQEVLDALDDAENKRQRE